MPPVQAHHRSLPYPKVPAALEAGRLAAVEALLPVPGADRGPVRRGTGRGLVRARPRGPGVADSARAHKERRGTRGAAGVAVRGRRRRRLASASGACRLLGAIRDRRCCLRSARKRLGGRAVCGSAARGQPGIRGCRGRTGRRACAHRLADAGRLRRLEETANCRNSERANRGRCIARPRKATSGADARSRATGSTSSAGPNRQQVAGVRQGSRRAAQVHESVLSDRRLHLFVLPRLLGRCGPVSPARQLCPQTAAPGKGDAGARAVHVVRAPDADRGRRRAGAGHPAIPPQN